MEEKGSDPQERQTSCCNTNGLTLETITDGVKYREDDEEKSGRNEQYC